MGVDQFPHRETPKVGPSTFSLRESGGRTLPHPPPGIPTGFCHKDRGCAAEALPRVKVKNINNPNGVVPMVRMGGVEWVCREWIWDIHSGRTPLPHPRTRSHSALVCRTPPAGTNGTTPCGVGNAMWPGPGVAPRRRNPGLYDTTPLALGAGNREWTRIGDINWAGDDPLCAWKRRRTGHRRFPSGNPKVVFCPIPPPGIPTGLQLRRWAWTNFPIGKRPWSGHRRFPSGNPEAARYPIPLRESQRDSAMKPGLYGATQRGRAERVRGVD